MTRSAELGLDALPGGSYRTEPIGHLEEHLRWMRKCGRVDSTLKARRATLTRLAEVIGHDPETATHTELDAWQDTLPSLISVRHQTQLIRPYYRWLRDRGYRPDDPAAALAMPPRPRRLPRPIPEHDLMRAVLEAPARVAPWLLLAGWTGMRSSDIAAMRRENCWVDVAGARWCRLTGKHGIERDVAIPTWVWDRIEPAMATDGWCWRRERGPGRGTGRRTAQHISQYANEYLAGLGLPHRMHSLRHRVGTATLADTGNTRLVQDVLGHVDPSTISVYTRVAGAARAEAVERLPRPPGAPPRPAPTPRPEGLPALDLSDDELDAHVAGWLACYRSPATRSGYGYEVAAWRSWCARTGLRPHQARRSDAERYRMWLEDGLHPLRGRRVGRYAPATVVRRLDAASSFHRYLVAEGLAATNPFRHVSKPPLELESSTPCLTRDEAALLAAAAAATGEREAALVWILLATGLRVSELCSADLTDLVEDGTGLHIRIVRKGSRPAQLAVPGAAGDALRAWLAVRPRTGSKALLTTGGLRLHRRRVHTELVRLCARAGITRVSAHGLRHTVATLLLDDGVSIWDVQAHLGHRRTETTLRYDRSRRARAGAAARRVVDLLAAPAAPVEARPVELADVS